MSVSTVSNLPERDSCWGRIILVAAGARKPLDQSFDILLAYGGKSVHFRSLNGCQNVDGTNRYKLVWMVLFHKGSPSLAIEIVVKCGGRFKKSPGKSG